VKPLDQWTVPELKLRGIDSASRFQRAQRSPILWNWQARKPSKNI